MICFVLYLFGVGFLVGMAIRELDDYGKTIMENVKLRKENHFLKYGEDL